MLRTGQLRSILIRGLARGQFCPTVFPTQHPSLFRLFCWRIEAQGCNNGSNGGLPTQSPSSPTSLPARPRLTSPSFPPFLPVTKQHSHSFLPLDVPSFLLRSDTTPSEQQLTLGSPGLSQSGRHNREAQTIQGCDERETDKQRLFADSGADFEGVAQKPRG